MASGMLYVRRETLDRLWPVAPRGVDASPPVVTPTRSAGHVGVPAALHKLGNIVPLRLARSARRGGGDGIPAAGRARAIEARIRELAIYARLRLQQLPGVELLTPARPGLWAGILTFRVPRKTARKLRPAGRAQASRLRARPALAGHAEGALRVSLHMFNTHDEVEKLVQGLQQALTWTLGRHAMATARYLMLTGSLSGLISVAGSAFGILASACARGLRPSAARIGSPPPLQVSEALLHMLCGIGFGAAVLAELGTCRGGRRAVVGARPVVRRPVLAVSFRGARASSASRCRARPAASRRCA